MYSLHVFISKGCTDQPICVEKKRELEEERGEYIKYICSGKELNGMEKCPKMCGVCK